ncbi:MAG: threonine synthase [Candidatus Aureabacteria bacterium]|nr:threonine synthase [Candidatus Auribacterota bacterium]
MSWEGVIRQYKKYLSVTKKTPVITLYEGNTPLLPATTLSREIHPDLDIYLKYEGMNPTGSFKDRGMTMAISKAVEAGAKAVMCASTGNTSASAAAYAARSGMKSFVLVPHNSIALGKLAQAAMHGAHILAIRGNFDDALKFVLQITEKYPVTLVNSLNPFRIEGQKSGAFEICDVLKKAPDYHAIPVGNAGNITAYWAGYLDYFNDKKISSLPKMIGFQAAGAAPIVLGKPVADPHTIATAIKIGNPASWKSAEQAAKDSHGLIDSVTDEEIIEAYQMLASLEGVFCEPASAASVAGVIKKAKAGYFQKGEKKTVVCILTGHGLKDPERAIDVSAKPIVIDANLEAIISQLGL